MGKMRAWALLTLAVGALVFTGSALADTVGIDFESPAYTPGTINGQDGWSSLGAAGSGCALYDHAVAAQSEYAGFGGQSLRMSNAVVSGCFGDQTFSKSLVDEAGETSAENGGMSGGTRQPYFDASWSFGSATGTYQPGLSVVASPDRGDGARMSWIQMADAADGLQVNFYDYAAGDFRYTTVASGLDRAVPHTIRVTMHFVDGPANDVVDVFVDGALVHTGTSWEDYFREQESNPPRTVDSILFRTGGTPGTDDAPGTAGAGFLIDDLSLTSAASLGCIFSTSGTTMTLVDDCTTDHTIVVPDGFTLDGDGHTITAVDPSGGHFVGGVVENGGSVANVTDVEITAADLGEVCDAGADRLRGILFDGAGGSITDTNVHGVRQGPSGCQEGNAIEVRNIDALGNPASTSVTVAIADNTATDYQKNGITVNGAVNATITGNTVTGDGPVDYIAQNGIQIGFGATALLERNTVSANDYVPDSFVACGLLFFEANGVKQKKNDVFANERDLCNFGRGGGRYDPQR